MDEANVVRKVNNVREDNEDVENIQEDILVTEDPAETNSKDPEKSQVEEHNHAVNREPPSFGSFTKFTIDQILNSKHTCKNQNNDVDAHSAYSVQNEETINKVVASWINESSNHSLQASNIESCDAESFRLSSYAEDHCPESPSSSGSDETLTIPAPGVTADDTDRTESSRSSPLPSHQSEYSWLHCTRYKPPKLPRSRRKEGIKRRKLGRNPRVPFTQHQVACLEQKFLQMRYLSSVDVAHLADALCISEDRVKIWFQNRRARERRDKESGQEVPDMSNNQQSNYSVNGSKSVKETFLSKGTSPLATLDHMSQEKYRLQTMPEPSENSLQMLKSPPQMTPTIPSYLLHGLLPSHLPWPLRPTENPFLTQRTLGLFNR